MTTLTIHELDPAVEQRLRDRAARHGHSIEEEVKHILQNVVGSTNDEPKNAHEAMRRHYRDLDGVDLELPLRGVGHDRSNPKSVATGERGRGATLSLQTLSSYGG